MKTFDSEGESMVVMVGSLTVGKHGAGAAKNLFPDPQVEGRKGWWGGMGGTGLVRALETSKPTSSDTPLSKMPYLLILVKGVH